MLGLHGNKTQFLHRQVFHAEAIQLKQHF